jgi:hypothetical protein
VHVALDIQGLDKQSIAYQFAQGREAVKRRAVTTALVLLRRTLTDRTRP